MAPINLTLSLRNSPMRIGVFGGSFDPVHRGHLALAESCWRQANLDRVQFVPAAQQPLKPQGPVAAANHRVAMVQLAIAGRPEFLVSTVEVARGGTSYSVDTLRNLTTQRPTDEFYFLMGADSLAEFPTWREPGEICRLAIPLVVRRAGAAEPNFEPLRQFVPPARLAAIQDAQVQMPPMPVSSSQIRELVAEGGAWRELVPPAVADYIAQHRLYQR